MNTSHTVVATRSGDWWTLEVTSGLSSNMLGVSQARRLTEVEGVARRLIADLLEIDPSTVNVTVTVELPDELTLAVELALDATAIERAAPRQGLHSGRLEFAHAVTGDAVDCTAEWPVDLWPALEASVAPPDRVAPQDPLRYLRFFNRDD